MMKDIFVRAAKTFLQAFTSVVIAGSTVFDISTLRAGVLAGLAAIISMFQNSVTALATPDTSLDGCISE